MVKMTEQAKEWSGPFGKDYTDRNALTVEQMDERFRRQHGISRSELYGLFLGEIDRSIKILEVGSNIGNQLGCLERMGFEKLYGIELQYYAIALSKSKGKDNQVIQASAFDIPFKGGCFDLVFTSGVLIHIHPNDIGDVLDEIYRCTRSFILGFEYYADELTKVLYRGHENLLWKRNFAQLYLQKFSSLQLVQEKRLRHLDNSKTDAMFLLRKKG